MTIPSAAQPCSEQTLIGGVGAPAAFLMERQRLIDVAKGVGILLVVCGHNAWMNDSHQLVGRLGAAIRLPLFFFVAGVTFPARRSVTGTLRRRGEALLKPFAVTISLLALWQFLQGRGSFEYLALELVYATGFTLSWEPLWFLPHLWLLSAFAAVVLAFGERWLGSATARALLLCSMIVAGYFLLHGFHNPLQDTACFHVAHFSAQLIECGLPFSADVLLISAFFLLLGHFLAAEVKRFEPSLLPLLLASVVFVTLQLNFDYTINLNFRLYDGLVVATLQALLGIYILISVCQYASRWPLLARTLGYVGSGSLFVLMFHYPVEDKAFLLGRQLHMPMWLAGTIAFAASVGVSLAFWEVAKRSRVLSSLLLPAASDGPDSRAARSAVEVRQP